MLTVIRKHVSIAHNRELAKVKKQTETVSNRTSAPVIMENFQSTSWGSSSDSYSNGLNPDGQVSTSDGPDGSLNYQYDGAGQLTGVTNPLTSVQQLQLRRQRQSQRQRPEHHHRQRGSPATAASPTWAT